MNEQFGFLDSFKTESEGENSPGAPVPTEEKTFWTYPLHQICTSNTDDVEILKILLSSHKIDERDEDYNTALHVACENGNPKIVLELLRRKADIDARNQKGHTPLILAAINNKVEVIRILINNGALIDYQTFDNRSALHFAASYGNAGSCKELLRNGANPFLKTSKGDYPESLSKGDVKRVFGEYREGIANIWKDTQRMKEGLGEEEIFLREFFDDEVVSLEPYGSSKFEVGKFFKKNEYAVRNYHRFMEHYDECIIKTLHTFREMEKMDRFLYQSEKEKVISLDDVIHGDVGGTRIKSVNVETLGKKNKKKKKSGKIDDSLLEKENNEIEKSQGYSKKSLIKLLGKTIRYSSISMSKEKWTKFIDEYLIYLRSFTDVKARILGTPQSEFEVTQKHLIYPKMKYLYELQMKSFQDWDVDGEFLKYYYLLRQFPRNKRIPIVILKKIWKLRSRNRVFHILRIFQQRGFLDFEFSTIESEYIYFCKLNYPQHEFLNEFFLDEVVNPLRKKREDLLIRLEEEKTFKVKKKRRIEEEVFEVEEVIEKKYSVYSLLFPIEELSEKKRKFEDLVSNDGNLLKLAKLMSEEDYALLANQKSASCTDKSIKTALIIGNEYYDRYPNNIILTTHKVSKGLSKSAGDAKVLAELLARKLGFTTSLLLNTKYLLLHSGIKKYCKDRERLILEEEENRMDSRVKRFSPFSKSSSKQEGVGRGLMNPSLNDSHSLSSFDGTYIGEGSISFIFYSGFGNSRRMYPVDFDFLENNLNYTITIQEFLSQLEESDFHRNGINIVILNLVDPFLKKRTILSSSLGSGFTKSNAKSNFRKRLVSVVDEFGMIQEKKPSGGSGSASGKKKKAMASRRKKAVEKRTVYIPRMENILEENVATSGIDFMPENPQFYIYVIDMVEKLQCVVDAETDSLEKKNSVFVRLLKRLLLMSDTPIDVVFRKLRFLLKNNFRQCIDGIDQSYELNYLMDDIILYKEKIEKKRREKSTEKIPARQNSRSREESRNLAKSPTTNKKLRKSGGRKN